MVSEHHWEKSGKSSGITMRQFQHLWIVVCIIFFFPVFAKTNCHQTRQAPALKPQKSTPLSGRTPLTYPHERLKTSGAWSFFQHVLLRDFFLLRSPVIPSLSINFGLDFNHRNPIPAPSTGFCGEIWIFWQPDLCFLCVPVYILGIVNLISDLRPLQFWFQNLGCFQVKFHRMSFRFDISGFENMRIGSSILWSLQMGISIISLGLPQWVVMQGSRCSRSLND